MKYLNCLMVVNISAGRDCIWFLDMSRCSIRRYLNVRFDGTSPKSRPGEYRMQDVYEKTAAVMMLHMQKCVDKYLLYNKI